MRKVGIMGGTFNPIHNAHLLLAEEARVQLGLDEIWFMPNNIPPHKSGAGMPQASQRIAMVKLAIDGNPHFECNLFEFEREGRSYSAETLTLLTQEHPDIRFYFLMGADSLMQFDTWYKPEVIASRAALAFSNRSGLSASTLESRVQEMKEKYESVEIYEVSMSNVDISSTDIRTRIHDGKTFRYMVPENVYAYICKEGLYL